MSTKAYTQGYKACVNYSTNNEATNPYNSSFREYYEWENGFWDAYHEVCMNDFWNETNYNNV